MIELSNINKTYLNNHILKNINLKINKGEFISIRAKSGAGKTTLLKIIGLLENPDSGTYKLLQKDTKQLKDEEKSTIRLSKIGYIFQSFNLIPSLTVTENIELPLALAGADKKTKNQRVKQLLEYFQLTKLANRFPETLSGGERQRIAIMRAISNNPQLLLADEPTSSIDDENSKILMNLFTKINQIDKITIILTSTNLYEDMPTDIDYILKNSQLYPLCTK